MKNWMQKKEKSSGRGRASRERIAPRVRCQARRRADEKGLIEIFSQLMLDCRDMPLVFCRRFSHPWSSAPAFVVPWQLFGIQATAPAYADMVIRPQVGSLTQGSYTLPTVRGTVAVNFTVAAGQFTLTADLPGQVRACVELAACHNPGIATWLGPGHFELWCSL